MDARAGLPGLMTRKGDGRRLNLTIGMAVALHALLALSGAWTRRATSLVVAPLKKEIAVQVEEQAQAPSAPGGGEVAASQAPEAAALPAAPTHTTRAPHHVLTSALGKDARTSASAAAFALKPTSTSDAPAAWIPSNSRGDQRLGTGNGGMGRGNGPGGLFGNGQIVGGGPGALKARVCFIPESTRSVKDIDNCEVIYEQFLDEINVPARRFDAGFPGFEQRTEWFAVNINGTFGVSEPGTYSFRLKSDDGSQLIIDNQLVVDNDGIHDAISKRGSIQLAEGSHRISLRYFQGMKFTLALQLFVTPPGSSERLFNTRL